jgi:hypothetical protein
MSISYYQRSVKTDADGAVYGHMEQVTLTVSQAESVEDFKAALAGWLLQPTGPWATAMVVLEASGVPHDDAEEIMYEAMESIVEDGFEDYR